MVDRLGGITPGDSPAEQAAAADLHVVNGITREGKNTTEEPTTSAVLPPTHRTSVSAKPAVDEHVTDESIPNSATHSSHRTTALTRLNGLVSKSSRTDATTGGSSTNSVQPVLVKTYDSKMKFAKSKRAKDTGSSLDEISEDVKYELPPLSAFSFQEILAAIDPEIRGSIDQIAEICGRSRLSLANEYDSHRPPHGGLDMPIPEESADGIHHVIHHHLEPVEETASSFSAEAQASADVSTQNTPESNSAEFRSTSWALLGLPSSGEGYPTAVTSNPVTQSYNVTSHPYSVTRPSEAHQQASSTTNGTTLPSTRTETATTGSEGVPFQNLLAWLQDSSDTELAMPEHTNATYGGRTAVGTLKGILES